VGGAQGLKKLLSSSAATKGGGRMLAERFLGKQKARTVREAMEGREFVKKWKGGIGGHWDSLFEGGKKLGRRVEQSPRKDLP